MELLQNKQIDHDFINDSTICVMGHLEEGVGKLYNIKGIRFRKSGNGEYLACFDIDLNDGYKEGMN